jgi:alpha-1,3-rhamnosyl/mannosyltransferase
MGRMHLLIDAREACGTVRTGKGQWTRGFIRALAAQANKQGIDITLLVEDHDYTDWAMSPSMMVRRFEGGMFWHLRVLAAIWKKELTGVYVGTTSFLVPFFAWKKIPTVIVVHDLIAFRGEPHDRKATFIEHLTLGRAARKARLVFTISESTRQDLLLRYPKLNSENVTPIFAGPMTPVGAMHASDGTTILCVATLCPRKNQERLIKAFAALPDDVRSAHHLLLCGNRGWSDDAIVKLAKKTEGVEWRGHITDEDYARLLSTCHVFALPSLYEGFGMQILDALLMGVPLLTSNRGSLYEVAGDAAVIVDPESVESISAGLLKLLSDAKLRKHLASVGPKQGEKFTWERTVEIFLNEMKIF